MIPTHLFILLNIQDDDAAPTMSFSANTAITATSGLESDTTPTIKVIIDNPSALTITGTYANNTCWYCFDLF